MTVMYVLPECIFFRILFAFYFLTFPFPIGWDVNMILGAASPVHLRTASQGCESNKLEGIRVLV